MKVLDASAWLQAWGTTRLERAGLDGALVPSHFDAEVLHATRGLVRGGRLTGAAGGELIAAVRAAPLLRVATTELLEAAWGLSEAVSGYDALYVALARREQVALLTADTRLARGATGLCEIQLLPE